ncbi:hypothetical protein BHE74_00050245 [Ensete ventricosum]|nr:hypothetical protein BHE74_00050245 [Ensete ventricosum]
MKPIELIFFKLTSVCYENLLDCTTCMLLGPVYGDKPDGAEEGISQPTPRAVLLFAIKKAAELRKKVSSILTLGKGSSHPPTMASVSQGELGGVDMSSTVDAAGEPIPTSAVLMAAAKHIAARCRAENVAFIKCKKKDPNPEKCLDKGRQVTSCVLNL